MNEYRGNRSTKYRLCIYTLLIGTALCALGMWRDPSHIQGLFDAWGLYVVGVVAAYVAADVGARWQARKAENGAPEGSQKPPGT